MPHPAGTGPAESADARFFKALRQAIESINDTLKSQLDQEAPDGCLVPIWQRLLVLTVAIGHDDHTTTSL